MNVIPIEDIPNAGEKICDCCKHHSDNLGPATHLRPCCHWVCDFCNRACNPCHLCNVGYPTQDAKGNVEVRE